MADLNDVMLAIGRLEGEVRIHREDFAEEKRAAAASRKAIYEKTDELSARIARVETDIGISGQINAQVREEVKHLGESVAQHKVDIQPSIDDMRKLKNLGMGISGVLAIGGLSVGTMLTMGLDAVKAALRQMIG